MVALSLAPVVGCIGVPFASLGGRGRVALNGTVGNVRVSSGRAMDVALQAHVGTAILSVTDPGPREWDLELGYVLDAFPGGRELDRHGGYAGLHWFPWSEDGVRVSVGGDVDALWGFDQRLAIGATLSMGIEGYTACEGAMGGGDLLYAGLVGWGRGEWGFGAQVQASYRFVDGEHYAMFGGSLSVRFPAGVGVGYVTALALADAAASSRGGSGSGSGASTTTSGASPTAPFGFCQHPIAYVPPDAEPEPPQLDRWRCAAQNAEHTEHETGYVRASSREEAIGSCRRDFTIARADGSLCTCSAAP